jgi:PilZ domain-containing protein
MLVETIFQYRTLIGKCELGVGLDWDEIDHVSRIEQAFAAERKDGRKFRRQVVELTAIMRGDMINDRVDVIEIGPGGMVCRDAPFIACGEIVEIVIEDGDNSYRFRARGVWLRDDGDHYRVGLAFEGMPVCLHNVQISAHTWDVVDKIANAA